MKDQNTTEYLEKLRNLKLSSDARLRMKEELSAYADLHAVRIADENRSINKIRNNSVFAFFTSSHLRTMRATLLIALVIGTGGTSLAAQGALPGELLYPVKVHVNENFRSTLALGVDAKAKLQMELLAERIKEAEELEAEGKFEGTLATHVTESVRVQSEKALTASQKASGATRLAVNEGVADMLLAFEGRADVSEGGAILATAPMQKEISTMMVEDSFSMKMAAEIDTEIVLESAQKRLESLTRLLKNIAGLDAELKTQFEVDLKKSTTYLHEAEALLKVGAKQEGQAKIDTASELMGNIEGKLSLLGELTLDATTGFILDVNFSGVPGNTKWEGEVIMESDPNASFESGMIDLPIEAGSSVEGVLGW